MKNSNLPNLIIIKNELGRETKDGLVDVKTVMMNNGYVEHAIFNHGSCFWTCLYKKDDRLYLFRFWGYNHNSLAIEDVTEMTEKWRKNENTGNVLVL